MGNHQTANSSPMGRALSYKPVQADMNCSPVPWSKYDWRDVTCNLYANGPSIAWNPAVYCIFAASFAVTMVVALHIICRNFKVFKKRKTIYFWSILVVSLGIIVETVSFILHIFILSMQSPAYITIDTFGLIAILTGFSMVLYSRLHLLTQNHRFMRGILIMISIVSILGLTPVVTEMIVLCTGDLSLGLRLSDIASYVQIIFAVQECVLSSLYIYFFWGYINDVPERVKDKLQKEVKATFCLLVMAYCWILMSNVLIYVLDFKKIFLARDLCFNPVYAIKLEIEFFVLNRLVRISQLKRDVLSNPSLTLSTPGTQLSQFAEPTRAMMSVSAALESQTGPDVEIEIAVVPISDG